MTTLFDEVAALAQSLSVEERAQLAQDMLRSIDADSDPSANALWEAELARRTSIYEAGTATLLTSQEVFAAARKITG